MIILNEKTIELFKEFVAAELCVGSDKITCDLRQVYVGESSGIGVLSTSASNVLTTDSGICFAIYSTSENAYLFGNNDDSYYYYLSHLGDSANLEVDNTYKLSLSPDTTLKGFFFKDIKVANASYPLKFYVLRFRRIAN